MSEFRKVEPLDIDGHQAAIVRGKWIDISREGFNRDQARALRDWLNAALEETNPSQPAL